MGNHRLFGGVPIQPRHPSVSPLLESLRGLGRIRRRVSRPPFGSSPLFWRDNVGPPTRSVTTNVGCRSGPSPLPRTGRSRKSTCQPLSRQVDNRPRTSPISSLLELHVPVTRVGGPLTARVCGWDSGWSRGPRSTTVSGGTPPFTSGPRSPVSPRRTRTHGEEVPTPGPGDRLCVRPVLGWSGCRGEGSRPSLYPGGGRSPKHRG